MKLFERSFDPVTGVVTEIGAQDGKLVHRYAADVAPSLDFTQALRNDEEYTKRGIKKNWWHVGHIPDVVCLKMLNEDGFNVWQANGREIINFIQRHKEKYGYLLTTTKRA